MTQDKGQVPEALRIADGFRECLECDAIPSIIDIEKAEAELRRLHTYCQELESQVIRDCMTHVQKPAENEHVADDVSKNGAELNVMDLIDAYAGARHIGGYHTYNTKTAEARAKVIAALRTQRPAPAGFVPVAAFDRLHAHAESLAARLMAAAPPHQEVQEPYGWLYDWTHSSATGKPDTTHTGFTKDEAHARKHDNRTTVFTTPPPPAAQQAGEIPESIEQLAVARYKVVPAHESMFHRWAVVTGDGAQQLYIGREVECENMARKFAGAFLDGAFLALQNATPPPSPTAQAAERVLEDAARYRAFRDCSMGDRNRLEHYSGPALDVAVDTFNAARKQGATP